MNTLDTLIAVSRAKPKERELCCPDCGADVVLRGGLYRCTEAPVMSDEFLPHGQSVWRELRHLATRDGEGCPF